MFSTAAKNKVALGYTLMENPFKASSCEKPAFPFYDLLGTANEKFRPVRNKPKLSKTQLQHFLAGDKVFFFSDKTFKLMKS